MTIKIENRMAFNRRVLFAVLTLLICAARYDTKGLRTNNKNPFRRNHRAILIDNNNPFNTTTEKATQNRTIMVNNVSVEEAATKPSEETTTKPTTSSSPVHEKYIDRTQHFQKKTPPKHTLNISENLLPLPSDATSVLIKPTKYHYYPHNQHMYILPECAIQQVCNAVYVRLNWTQPLCACPLRYKDPCSASLNTDDQHTTEIMIDTKSKLALTLVKTCEQTSEMRVCKSPKDWALLALQNIRTGKSHYLVICRCSEPNVLEGPISHDQPNYASVPGIRVYGMLCVDEVQRARSLLKEETTAPEFPWEKANAFIKTITWN